MEIDEKMRHARQRRFKMNLSVSDLEEAEVSVVKFVQNQAFPDEIASLRDNSKGGSVKKRSPIYKLDPRYKDGVLRVGGRLSRSAMPELHLEVAHALDTDSCINALRRFIARRGQVGEIWSDNGTNLVATDRELKRSIQEWNDSKIRSEMLQVNVDWKYSPPTGSHYGGVWERQIRTVRQILNVLLRSQTLSDESLQTFLCEVEATINSRPLTTVSLDLNDVEPLTPNHLLLLKGKPNLPPGVFVKTDVYVRRRWRQAQFLADLFWKRWLREYLPQLQQRQKWLKPKRNFEPGDIVLIVEDNAPRNSWLMGRITSVLSDQRGEVRRVKVKTASSELERPIAKLCLLLEADE
ncbi:hypothetical protein BSL78_22828 [Apostichopus japonicus]|uniref:DUF5641 domain-containing protein n=1 Tax=Stichopus japonicus TaxID=307972 RepID=A0A2G8JX54_STIJA|nr:hypothetical protein BSL78_22828 [Apostichopus japonicus]